MACTTCLVCFIGTVKGGSKKKEKKGKCFGSCGASSGHTTKLKQSIFFRYLWSQLVKISQNLLIDATPFGKLDSLRKKRKTLIV